MGELLVGVSRRRRATQPYEEELGQAFPGGKVYLSFPGLGDRLAARVAGEIGDHPQQFGSPNALACYAGKAPVTRRSGRSELVVATRLACNRHLADAVQQWAFCSLRCSGWAREFYDAQPARGKTHHSALRALGNRWLEILWHCLMRGQPAARSWSCPFLLPGRAVCPWNRGTVDTVACRETARGKRWSQRSRPCIRTAGRWPARLPSWLVECLRLGVRHACTVRPAPSTLGMVGERGPPRGPLAGPCQQTRTPLDRLARRGAARRALERPVWRPRRRRPGRPTR
jgi:Transposase IS116/IS110/IS902 family